MTKQPTICLNMIVKDEAHVIKRCLEGVADVIDYWVISDTGSSDGTKEIIQDFFKSRNIDGELHQHPWLDFSHNRNLALDLAKNKADYILIMDADDQLIHDNNSIFHQLKKDSYFIECNLGEINYSRKQLIKSQLPWKWVGVIHEYLHCNQSTTTGSCSNVHIIASTEGARGKNSNRYKADIKLLKKGLSQEPNNARYQFYLAQSYRDDKNWDMALKEYQNRVAMSGWDEEVYYSLLQIGKVQENLKLDISLILNSYLAAYHFRPTRLEALHHAISLCRQSEQYHLGYSLGKTAINTPIPTDVLFVTPDVYHWKFKDEISICASWIGHKDQSRSLINEILELDYLDNKTRERLENNLNYC